MNQTDLDLVSTPALLDALHRRYDGALFVGLRDVSTEQEEPDYSYSGSVFTALGLAVWVTPLLQQLPCQED